MQAKKRVKRRGDIIGGSGIKPVSGRWFLTLVDAVVSFPVYGIFALDRGRVSGADFLRPRVEGRGNGRVVNGFFGVLQGAF